MAAVGNVGRPIIEAILDEVDYDVLAVELSSFQLHWSDTLALHSAAVLNLQADHLEWYAHEHDPYAAYAADKAKIYERVTHACVYNVADPATEKMVEEADVTEGARAIGFTLGVPAPSMLGVVDDLLVDRAFVEQRRDSAMPLAELTDVRPFAPHNVENALAAAALARSFGVPPQAVAQGLRDLSSATTASRPSPRSTASAGSTTPRRPTRTRRRPRCARSTRSCGSPAARPRAPLRRPRHRPTATKLRGAVLLGVDRGVIADALARHAPDVPVIVIDSAETGAMAEAVGAAAAGLAKPGRHGPPGARMCQQGHVDRVRRPRARLRRRGADADRPVTTSDRGGGRRVAILTPSGAPAVERAARPAGAAPRRHGAAGLARHPMADAWCSSRAGRPPAGARRPLMVLVGVHACSRYRQFDDAFYFMQRHLVFFLGARSIAGFLLTRVPTETAARRWAGLIFIGRRGCCCA